jgi:hypothetical protein
MSWRDSLKQYNEKEEIVELENEITETSVETIAYTLTDSLSRIQNNRADYARRFLSPRSFWHPNDNSENEITLLPNGTSIWHRHYIDDGVNTIRQRMEENETEENNG